jgi:asparagine synthase (glutamine-hydrolysing)
LHDALGADGLAGQFHPTYTRMVPAHFIVDLALVGCPDPEPTYTRFFTPERGALPADLDEIGRRYIGALADEVAKWLHGLEAASSAPGSRLQASASVWASDGPGARSPKPEAREAPIGVAFSGGIDSGSVFLVAYHVMRRLGMSPSRLKAFVLNVGDGPDVAQARDFLSSVGLSLFLEEIEATPADLDVCDTLRVVEDYKTLDVECAAMGLRLCRGVRDRYPEWRYLLDGDGGDENLKDYPIEENAELTIRSVVDNLMLYQEGWGVGRIKHSLAYSGGLSRSYVRTYAPARRYGFDAFSPYTRPDVIEVAEGIPFAALTGYDVPTLYSLKGDIVGRGIKALTGIDMPVFPKRRFQHGAMPVETMHARLGHDEGSLRRMFHGLYA